MFEKIKGMFAARSAPVPPPGLDEVFQTMREGNPKLAERLVAYITTGQDVGLMSLTPDELTSINHWVHAWVLSSLLLKHWPGISSEQWVRLGQIMALSPRIDYDQARWPEVPGWFGAVQLGRQAAHGSRATWDADFIQSVLPTGGVPAEQVAPVALAGFVATLAHRWNRYNVSTWKLAKDPDPRRFVDLVQAHITLLPPLLARATTPTRIEVATWLGFFPELLPPLAPMLSEWAVCPTKTVREAAISLIAELPEVLRNQTLGRCLTQGAPSNLDTVIDQVSKMGDDGQGLLAAATGSGGRRDELLSAAINRHQLAAQTPQVNLEIPPAPPVDTTPLGPEFTGELLAAVGRWAARLEPVFATNSTQHIREDMEFALSFSSKDAEAVRSWLNGHTDRPQVHSRLPRSINNELGLPLLAAVRCTCSSHEGRVYFSPQTVSRLTGRHHDLRCLDEAARLAGVTDPPRHISHDVFQDSSLLGLAPELVWPYFAEHLELIDEALGLPPAKPNHDQSQLSIALRLLAMFPALPTRYVPFLARLATGDSKTFRRQAQELLERQANVVDIAAQTLSNSKAEVRSVGAVWIARIGDPAGIGVLRTALSGEQSEEVQAAMLNALRLLGDDISAYLAPEAMAAAAEQAKPPAGLNWFPFDALPDCCWADGTPVDPEIIRWWVVMAVKLKDPLGVGLIPLYVNLLDLPSRQALGSYVFDTWMAYDTAHPSDEDCRAHAAAKVDARFSLYQDHPEYYPAQSAMTHDQVFEELRREKAKEYLRSAYNERGLLALTVGAPGHHVFAATQRYIRDHGPRRRPQVEALIVAASANPDPAAIQLVLGVARKFKMETVRLKAVALAEEIAERYGWTMDELADRTIPTAGFDESGLLSLDFGARTFTGRITRSPKTAAFTIEVASPDGKKIAALPKPGAADDEDLARESRKQLTTSKKELTQVVAAQTVRLFEAMCLQRSWSATDWRDYLLGHPVMRHLVSTLVWQAEIAEGGYIAFRPTVDGELLTSDDETFDLPEGAKVRLAHRAIVTEAEADQWRTHLTDYKVTPLFNQFEAVAPPVAEGGNSIDDHQGWLSSTFAIRGRATKLGYNRGASGDNGWFTEYYKDLPSAGIRVVVEFTGSGYPEQQFPAAVKCLVFTRSGRQMLLTEVPPILLAESYSDYVHIAEAGTYDQDWQAKSVY